MAEEQRAGGTGAAPDAVLKVATRREDGRAVVELAGELDVEGVDRLISELNEVMTAPGVEHLEIHAGDLTFIDSAGLNALVVVSEDADARGIGFELATVSALVQRVIEIAGLEELLKGPGP